MTINNLKVRLQSWSSGECIVLFINPSARSIFKQILAGLNPEFSFSQTSCLAKAEEPSLSYYLPIAGGRIFGFIPFPRVLVLCECNQSGFELVSPCPYPATITNTPRTPPFWGMCSTPSQPLLPGPLKPGVVVTVRILSMDQIELFSNLTLCKQMADVVSVRQRCLKLFNCVQIKLSGLYSNT